MLAPRLAHRTTLVVLAAVLALFAGSSAAVADIGAAAPGVIRDFDVWTAVDGVGARWHPPAVSPEAAEPTSYKVFLASGPTGTPVLVDEFPAATGDGWAAYTHPSRSGFWSVIATNDAGDGPRSHSIFASGVAAPVPTDGYDLAYAHNGESATAEFGEGGSPPVLGDRDAVTFSVPDHPSFVGGTLSLNGLARGGNPVFPLALTVPGQSGPHLTLISTTQGPCQALGFLDAFAPQWHADGSLATVIVRIRAHCLASVSIVLSLGREREILPALPVFSSGPYVTTTYGATVHFPLAFTNVGGQSVRYSSRLIAHGDAFDPAQWSIGDDDCTDLPFEPDETCTVDVVFKAPDDGMGGQGARLALTSEGGTLTILPIVAATIEADPLAPSALPSVGSGQAGSHPVMEFTVEDPDDTPTTITTRCRVQGLAWSACTSPWTPAEPLPQGWHLLQVQPRDLAGHWGDVAGASVNVDLSAPTSALKPLSRATLRARVGVRWSGSDTGGSGIASFQLRYRYAPVGSGFGSYRTPARWSRLVTSSISFTARPGYQYCFSVRARDHVGNVGAWSSPKCTSVALDDRALTPSTGDWSRSTDGSAAYGTLTTSRGARARLTETGVHARQIGLVFRACAVCGPVDVYHAGRWIGRLSTAAASTKPRTVRWLRAADSARAGSIVLRTVNGRLVAIDGVLIRH